MLLLLPLLPDPLAIIAGWQVANSHGPRDVNPESLSLPTWLQLDMRNCCCRAKKSTQGSTDLRQTVGPDCPDGLPGTRERFERVGRKTQSPGLRPVDWDSLLSGGLAHHTNHALFICPSGWGGLLRLHHEFANCCRCCRFDSVSCCNFMAMGIGHVAGSGSYFSSGR